MARHDAQTRPAHCPGCHQDVVPTPILWGLPSWEGFEAAHRGEVVLGGCIVGGDDPSHVCPNCEARLHESPGGGFELWAPAWPVPWDAGLPDRLN